MRASRVALGVLLTVMMLNMLGFGVIVPLLPFYARSFHAPGWQIALMFSAYAAGAFFGEPLWGRLSDRIGRKPLLVTTVAANAVCFLSLAFAPDIFTATLVRFLGGVAGGNGSVVGSYIADVTPASHRAGRMGLLGAAYNVGFIFGPGLGGLLARPELGPVGFRPPLLAASALAATAALLIVPLVRESRRRAARTPAASEAGEGAGPAGAWAEARAAFRHPVVAPLMLLTFVVGLAFNGFESTFGFWATRRYAWSTAAIGYCFTVAAVASTLGQGLFAGPLARRFGQTPMLVAGIAMAAVCLVVQPGSPGGVASAALMTLMWLGQALAYPNTTAMISRATPPEHQGQTLGINNAMDAISRLVGPQAALALFAWAPDAPFYAGAAVLGPSIALALMAGRALRRSKGQGSREAT